MKKYDNFVYGIFFEDESMYIGITNNFKQRMTQHEKEAKDGNMKPCYVKMREMSYEKIILYNARYYEEALEMEHSLICNLREILGVEKVLNISDGGEDLYGVRISKVVRDRYGISKERKNNTTLYNFKDIPQKTESTVMYSLNNSKSKIQNIKDISNVFKNAELCILGLSRNKFFKLANEISNITLNVTNKTKAIIIYLEYHTDIVKSIEKINKFTSLPIYIILGRVSPFVLRALKYHHYKLEPINIKNNTQTPVQKASYIKDGVAKLFGY